MDDYTAWFASHRARYYPGPGPAPVWMNWAYGVMKRLTEENLIKLEAACERSAAQFLSRLEPYLADLVPGADDIVFTEVNWDDLTLDFLGEERDDAGL